MVQTERPTVSVIVPVYNVEAYLPACMDSILNQSYPHLQVILADDGSTDGSGVICDQYASRDSRVTVIHQRNTGVSGARNAALEAVAGRYVTFCDSDDRYAPAWIEALVNAMESREADVAVGNFVKVYQDGTAPSVSGHETGVYPLIAAEDRMKYCLSYLLEMRHGWECWMRLFRSDIVRENGIRFCESCENYAEDLGFVLEYMLYAGKVVSIPEAGYLYLIWDGSMMGRCGGEIKLNALNEVSAQVSRRVQKTFGNRFAGRWMPVLHYAILYTEYRKFIYGDFDGDLTALFCRIQKKRQWRRMTMRICFGWKELKEIYGLYAARTVLVMSWCFLLRDWRMFRFWCGRMKNGNS